MLGVIFYFLGLSLTFIFYDWKLAVILTILTWANNFTMIETYISPLAKNIKIILGAEGDAKTKDRKI